MEFPEKGEGTILSETDESILVGVAISAPNTPDRFQDVTVDNRARYRAIVTSGLESEGSIVPDVDLSMSSIGDRFPGLDRKTEILKKNDLGNDNFEYEIRVKKGMFI